MRRAVLLLLCGVLLSVAPTEECGAAFCYGRIAPAEVEASALEWSDIVAFAEPAVLSDEFGYVEDSQARRNVLDGFELNNEAPSESSTIGAVGYTYLGQLLSHDINLDKLSVLGVPVDPQTLPNKNTAWLDLDMLYDFDGTKAEDLEGYLDADKRFVLSPTPANGLTRDFARRADGTAILLDKRNDEHRIVSQMTVAFMALHNKFVDCALNFAEANAKTIREWQGVVLFDLLPNLLDASVLEAVKNGDRKLYREDLAAKGVMPVEFTTAAYRIFHSRARGRCRMNANTDGSTGNPRARLFDVGNDDEPVLTGGSPLEDLLVIEWDRFFGPTAQVSRIMDMLYSRPMVRLPIGTPGHPEAPVTVDCDTEEACPIDESAAQSPQTSPYSNSSAARPTRCPRASPLRPTRKTFSESQI